MKGLTYQGTGVNYDVMDPFKRMAQLSARETAQNINRFGLKEVEASRGESVYLVEADDHFLAHVEEGLGTKNLVAEAVQQLHTKMYAADELERLTGKSHYDSIAQDTVAMIVNDMITLGALPISVAMHLAVGSSDWFKDQGRTRDLIKGWKAACDMARCTWSGGETPTLKQVVMPSTAVLSGSAMGILKPKARKLDGSKIRDGDSIVLVQSSGIHANGLTLAREIAAKMSRGYLERLSDGRTYGETLLDPTIIYVPLVEDCLNAGIDLHYAVNITGHGWRKLMRADRPLRYVLNWVPKPQPIFDFIQKNGPVSDEEAYGNLNMGAGFAFYLPRPQASRVIAIAGSLGLQAWDAGYIEATSGEKEVVIEPKGITFKGSSLAVR